MNQPDPRAAFLADQAAAKAETETREAQVFAVNLRDAEAKARLAQAMADRTAAWAHLINVVAWGLGFAVAAGVVVALVLALRTVGGWF